MLRLRTAALLLLAGAAAAASAQPAPAPGAQPAPMAVPDIPVTAEVARQTALELAQALQDNYAFPDVAGRYGAMLRANATSGAYDGLASGKALAERLTADLRAVSPDNHLRVRVAPPREARAPGPGEVGPIRRMVPLTPIEEQRWLAPGIAYIRFNVFPGDAETVAAVRKFMIDHADAKTIIFDNRTHHGGGLAEMDAMFPYLFARPTTLVTMDTRTSVDRARGSPMRDARLRLVPAREDVVRREHFVEPDAAEKRLFGAKVFVLTSGATASAAEHMTLALKRTHRATIVGEATAGAGNYGGQQTVGGDRFVVFIPVGRTFDPDTGKGWEGSGIEPDVAVPAEKALTEALVRSGLSAADAERISAEVKPTGPMVRRTPRV
ncbi:MAG: S41 family peptidase [Alphaproteobacteria bacterium]|nr:S41 family peptidase [Alphaproteobacteria bacterium]